MAYEYFDEDEEGRDLDLEVTCPDCGATLYSSIFLENHDGGSARCPHCGCDF